MNVLLDDNRVWLRFSKTLDRWVICAKDDPGAVEFVQRPDDLVPHTPDKWRINAWDGRIYVQRGLEGGFVVQGLSRARELADARLIAAAPTMLKALREAEEALVKALAIELEVDHVLAEKVTPDSTLGIVRAAIKEATG